MSFKFQSILRLNLLGFILLILLIFSGFTVIQQKVLAKRYKKAFEAELSENANLKYRLMARDKTNDSLRLNIEYLSLTIKKEETKRRSIISSYKRERDKLTQTPIEEIISSLHNNEEPVGTIYDIDSSHVLDYGLVKLNMKECEELSTSLIRENEVLHKSIGDYADVAVKLLNDADNCKVEKIGLENQIKKKDLKEKKLKGKLWKNRGVAGVLGVILVVAVLI